MIFFPSRSMYKLVLHNFLRRFFVTSCSFALFFVFFLSLFVWFYSSLLCWCNVLARNAFIFPSVSFNVSLILSLFWRIVSLDYKPVFRAGGRHMAVPATQQLLAFAGAEVSEWLRDEMHQFTRFQRSATGKQISHKERGDSKKKKKQEKNKNSTKERAAAVVRSHVNGWPPFGYDKKKANRQTRE